MDINIYMHRNINEYLYIYICAQMLVNIKISMYDIHTYIHACIHTYIHIFIYICVCK